MDEKLKTIKGVRKERWYEKKERYSGICKDLVMSMLDITEEAHIIKRNGDVTKEDWRVWMDLFTKGDPMRKTDASAFAYVPQMTTESDEEEADGSDQIDHVELQNYLSAIGKWRPESILEFKRKDLLDTLTGENILFPSYSEAYNNPVLGTVAKDITEKKFAPELDEIKEKNAAKVTKAKETYPHHMPVKLSIVGPPLSGKKTVANQLIEEYNLTELNVSDIVAEVEALTFAPEEEEDPKAKKKKDEPEVNPEEQAELKAIGEKIKLWMEENDE